jgi:hypothetical protein
MIFAHSRATPPCSALKRLILAVCLGLFVGMGPILLAQVNVQRQSPSITLNLPQDIASETVQINYFMIGPFGGHGAYVETEKGRVSYDIPGSVNGKAAETVKIIAYMPGCEIVKLEIAIHGLSDARTLPCQALGRVPLHGSILSVPIAQNPGADVEINYLADWDHEFFGIADGMVTSIHVATAFPDEEGRFGVALPDFFRQTELGKGSFQFLLRNRVAGNIVATLTPVNMPQYFGGLEIRSSYAPFVLFSADTSVSKPPPTDSVVVEDRQEH